MFLKEINKHLEVSTYLKIKKGFLFDLDGTLINSEPIHIKAIVDLLEQFNIVKYSTQEIHDKYIGWPDIDVFKDLKNEFPQINISSKKMIRQKSELIVNKIKELDRQILTSLITPGMLDFLDYLKENNKKLALVTASEGKVAQEILTQSGLIKYFKVIRHNENTFLSKPNPSPYLSAMRALGLRSDETVIFEDSKTGLKAAKSTSAKVIQIPLPSFKMLA